jgi:hypothetical protein
MNQQIRINKNCSLCDGTVENCNNKITRNINDINNVTYCTIDMQVLSYDKKQKNDTKKTK